MKRLVYIIGLSLLLYACGEQASPETKSQGKITYAIKYPDISDDHFMKTFLPDEMSLFFSGKWQMNEMKAGMGTFKSNFVSNAEDSTIAQYVKVFTKKYALVVKGNEILPMLQRELPDYNVELTGVTKYIADLPCEEVKLTFVTDTLPEMLFYFTKEINIKKPNWCNPYYKIDGVLMQYEYTKYGIRMVFTAKNVTFCELDEMIFTDFKNYKMLSQEEMDKQMAEIFESFSY